MNAIFVVFLSFFTDVHGEASSVRIAIGPFAQASNVVEEPDGYVNKLVTQQLSENNGTHVSIEMLSQRIGELAEKCIKMHGTTLVYIYVYTGLALAPYGASEVSRTTEQ